MDCSIADYTVKIGVGFVGVKLKAGAIYGGCFLGGHILGGFFLGSCLVIGGHLACRGFLL